MTLELIQIERMFARKEPFEAIIAALDEFLTRPDADAFRSSVEHSRVSAYCNYGRPPDECATVLDYYLSVESDLVLRADTVWLACSLVPALGPRYLEAQIAALEDAPASARTTGRLGELRKLRKKSQG